MLNFFIEKQYVNVYVRMLFISFLNVLEFFVLISTNESCINTFNFIWTFFVQFFNLLIPIEEPLDVVTT